MYPGRLGGSEATVGPTRSPAATEEGGVAQGERKAPGGADDRTIHSQPQEEDGVLFQGCSSREE